MDFQIVNENLTKENVNLKKQLKQLEEELSYKVKKKKKILMITLIFLIFFF